jgi:hypothetical protein
MGKQNSATELSTDAYVFLKVRDPVCAWATYRGVLVGAPPEGGFLSGWAAALLKANVKDRLLRELALERGRREQFNNKISRVRGMFCFLDIQDAERACAWGTPSNHFRQEYLAELHLGETGPQRDRFDANWISYQDLTKDVEAVYKYWRAAPFPGREPIWETLIDGRASILNTEIRERAYSIIKSRFESLAHDLLVGSLLPIALSYRLWFS